jgi:putative oxidoreductase
MEKIHAFIHRFHNHDVALLCVRIALGVAFTHAGWLKVTHLSSVVDAFTAMHFYGWLGYLVAFSELIAGILILVGICVRYAALVISVIMIVAIIGVHLKNGFGMQLNGMEYPFVLLFIALSIFFSGAGAYSLARLIKKTS